MNILALLLALAILALVFLGKLVLEKLVSDLAKKDTSFTNDPPPGFIKFVMRGDTLIKVLANCGDDAMYDEEADWISYQNDFPDQQSFIKKKKEMHKKRSTFWSRLAGAHFIGFFSVRVFSFEFTTQLIVKNDNPSPEKKNAMKIVTIDPRTEAGSAGSTGVDKRLLPLRMQYALHARDLDVGEKYTMEITSLGTFILRQPKATITKVKPIGKVTDKIASAMLAAVEWYARVKGIEGGYKQIMKEGSESEDSDFVKIMLNYTNGMYDDENAKIKVIKITQPKLFGHDTIIAQTGYQMVAIDQIDAGLEDDDLKNKLRQIEIESQEVLVQAQITLIEKEKVNQEAAKADGEKKHLDAIRKNQKQFVKDVLDPIKDYPQALAVLKVQNLPKNLAAYSEGGTNAPNALVTVTPNQGNTNS